MTPGSSSPYMALPKVELHVHLDTSLSLAAVQMLRPGISEEEYRRTYVAPAHCRDLKDFLGYALPAIALLQRREALSLALRQLMRELAAEGVLYAEIRLAPLLHTREGLTAEVVAATLCAALAEGRAETGLEAGLLFCTLRHFTGEESMQTVRLAAQFRDSGVVGLDLAGDEAGYDLAAHLPAYAFAAEAGLPATVHAGEAAGPESVRACLALPGVRRIGHGVRSAEDPALVARLVQEGIHLEVCPGSNIQTGVFPDIRAHTLDRLYRAGVSLSINTDGRGLTATDLCSEYALVAEAFGWGPADFLRTNQMAVAAAFCDPATRDRLLDRLQNGPVA